METCMKYAYKYFQGEYKNNLREGKGKFTFANKDYYDV